MKLKQPNEIQNNLSVRHFHFFAFLIKKNAQAIFNFFSPFCTVQYRSMSLLRDENNIHTQTYTLYTYVDCKNPFICTATDFMIIITTQFNIMITLF